MSGTSQRTLSQIVIEVRPKTFPEFGYDFAMSEPYEIPETSGMSRGIAEVPGYYGQPKRIFVTTFSDEYARELAREVLDREMSSAKAALEQFTENLQAQHAR